jgi:hypothetical protein
MKTITDLASYNKTSQCDLNEYQREKIKERDSSTLITNTKHFQSINRAHAEHYTIQGSIHVSL